ncbi:rhodanese-like domain-containing protein [Pedobacter sp.]|uniref:rhodanese-like domain-containing protein n=1 Tax=Pedobacter sp. TaxID=1411316 RepID=UPI003D7F5D4F
MAISVFTVNAQSLGKKEFWQKSQLMEPATLVDLLKGAEAKRPIIYNIGFVSDIPGAENLGAANAQKGLEQLKKAVQDVPKDKLVVIYCGCCPFEHCPNVLPAYTLLKSLGYSQAKVLNLPTSLKADWLNKGYPLKAK